MNKILKRDGSRVKYDRKKIKVAISKANKEVTENEKATSDDIENIVKYIEANNIDSVEEIQDKIEEQLMAQQHFALSKAFILYRYRHALKRQANTTDASILSLLNYENASVMEENSNKNAYIASTQRDLIAGEVSKDLTKRLLLPEHIVDAHNKGILHFHDMDYFLQSIFNCCLINIGDMLDNGTIMNGKLIESPKSFQVACNVMTQIIASVASGQYGGQSVNIKHLGKYLKKSKDKFIKSFMETCPELDDETIMKLADARLHDELKSGVQTIQYQINTLMSTNGPLVNGCFKIS